MGLHMSLKRHISFFLPALFAVSVACAVDVADIAANVACNNSATAALDSYTEFLIGNSYTPNPLKVQQGDNRMTGQQDLLDAQSYAVATLTSFLGAGQVYGQTFSGGCNYIGELAGGDPLNTDVVVIGAHIDSTNSHDPGASSAPGGADNGSGVAALLESARVLSQYEFASTIRFIVFDHEESGWDENTGSWQYVNSLTPAEQNAIVSMTTVDMIGYNHEGGNTATLCIEDDTEEALAWQGQFATAIEDYTTLELDLTKESKWADHHAFHSAGISAGLLIEELTDGNWPENPYYHTANDYVIDTEGNFQTLPDSETPYVDVDYATEMTKATVAWAATLATPIPEPGAAVFMAVVGGGAFMFRRIFAL